MNEDIVKRLVEIHRIKCIVGLAALVIVLVTFSVIFYRAGMRMSKIPADEATVPDAAIAVASCLVVVLTFVTLAFEGLNFVSGAFYPEASLILEWITPKKG